LATEAVVSSVEGVDRLLRRNRRKGSSVRVCERLFTKWHLDPSQEKIEVHYDLPSIGPNHISSDELWYFISDYLQPLLPENDEVLVVMNDLLGGFPSKWHKKEQYVAALKSHGGTLIICNKTRLDHFEMHPHLLTPVTGVWCRVCVPRRWKQSSATLREEYLILSHPRDALLTLLVMPQKQSVDCLMRLICSPSSSPVTDILSVAVRELL
jgi:hypothetical protein